MSGYAKHKKWKRESKKDWDPYFKTIYMLCWYFRLRPILTFFFCFSRSSFFRHFLPPSQRFSQLYFQWRWKFMCNNPYGNTETAYSIRKGVSVLFFQFRMTLFRLACSFSLEMLVSMEIRLSCSVTWIELNWTEWEHFVNNRFRWKNELEVYWIEMCPLVHSLWI